VHALFIIASVLPARSTIAATISNVIFIGNLASQEPISLLLLLSQKVAGDCHWESVIEGDSHFSI
jgi:hypothetical protein